jgi:hypothetical protein
MLEFWSAICFVQEDPEVRREIGTAWCFVFCLGEATHVTMSPIRRTCSATVFCKIFQSAGPFVIILN